MKSTPLTLEMLKAGLAPIYKQERELERAKRELKEQYIEDNRKFKKGQEVKRLSNGRMYVVRSVYFDAMHGSGYDLSYSLSDTITDTWGIIGIPENDLQPVSEVEIL